jgi:hypothetical protein
MSATKASPAIASKTRRRKPRQRGGAARPPLSERISWTDLLYPPVGRRPAEPPPVLPGEADREAAARTWWDWFSEAERARAERLRPLWEMSPAQRVVAMRRGELSYERLAAWSSRHPEQIPMINGELEWIAAKMPEVCE